MSERGRGTGLLATACCLALAAPGAGFADQGGQPPATGTAATAEEIAALRHELDTLRQQYATRIAELEARLAAIEGAGARGVGEAPPAPASPTAQAAPSTEATPAPPPAATAENVSPPFLPTSGGAANSSKVFNPDIAAIGDFIGAAGKSPGSGEPSLEMHEAELSFQAVVDPYARADFFLTVGPEGAGVEEAFITFPALPGGLLLRAGKMRDAFGKVDAQHNHVLPYIDRPLVAKNLLGGEDGLADAGISVARLIPNPWLFLEATGQVFRGESSVFKAPTRGDLAYVGHLRAYRDLTESTNVDLGGSLAYGHNDALGNFTTRLFGADATFRYRPLRRSIYTHLLARGELVWSRLGQVDGERRSLGGYGYLEYQFARRWFAGLRYDDTGLAAAAGRDRGGSFILTYWPSEFSQVRAQFRRTRFADTRIADEVLFQFIYAIGAHGAHAF